MASFEVEVGATALGQWASLPTHDARRVVHDALLELRQKQFPPGSFRLVGDPVWRLVRGEVEVLYVATAHGCYVTEVRVRR